MSVQRRLPQLHSVENSNRQKRVGVARDHTEALISQPGANTTGYDLDGRLTVIPLRKFEMHPGVKYRTTFDWCGNDDVYERTSNEVNQVGPLCAQECPVVTATDSTSLFAAFNKRCNFVQDGKLDDVNDAAYIEILDMLKDVKDKVTDMELFTPWDENESDRDRWLSKFDDNKRTTMKRTFMEIDSATYKKIRNKTLMVKRETLLKRDDQGWAPRAIYVGSDEHNAITGPAMMVWMERLCQLTRRTTVGPVKCQFAYKKSDIQLMEFINGDEDRMPFRLEGDYSRNDREQRKRVAAIMDYWLEICAMPMWLRKLMVDSSDKYDVYLPALGLVTTLKYQLPTGTTATTPRNSAWNLTQFALSMKRQGVSLCRALILGDDLYARTDIECDLKKWEDTVSDCKMVLKAAAPEESHGTFLSRNIIENVPDKLCMMPKFMKAMYRYGSCAVQSQCTLEQYKAGKALSHAYEFRHAPFISDRFLKDFERFNVPLEDMKLSDLSWFTRKAGLDTPELIMKAIRDEKVKLRKDELEEFFCEVYGIDIIEVGEYLDQYVGRDDLTMHDDPLHPWPSHCM